MMVTSCWLPVSSTLRTTSSPLITFPKTTCFPSEEKILSFNFSDSAAATTKVRSRAGENEELWAVGVRALVGHRENSGLIMLQLKVLVRKIPASIIDWLAAGSLQSEDVSTLDDEAGHNTVETGELVTVAVVSAAENPSREQSTDLYVIIKNYKFRMITTVFDLNHI